MHMLMVRACYCSINVWRTSTVKHADSYTIEPVVAEIDLAPIG